MDNHNSLENILFIDIETSGSSKSFLDLTIEMKALWTHKANRLRRFDETLQQLPDEEIYLLKSAIYSEFAQIICISCAYFKSNGEKSLILKIKSFYGCPEDEMIQSFFNMVEDAFQSDRFRFYCGHNIREFDLPFICRRALINGLRIPAFMDYKNKRPWQVNNIIDTLEMWRFGDYKSYSSLELLCNIFKIDSPKSDMDGSSMHIAYWYGQKIEKIKRYCENDVKATAELYIKLSSSDFKSLRIEMISQGS